MTEADAIARSVRGPVTVSMLVADLAALGVAPGMTLLVQSSLSALGWVCGGAQAVIQALQQLLGPSGTLVMPAHTGGLGDPAQWQNPPVPEAWRQTILDEMPAFDPALTPTRWMGVIAETFRSYPGVRRSTHPAVSFAARGPLAVRITARHVLDDCLGEDSPLARLYELDARVLLLGVGHSNNTSLHLAEYRANYPGKRYEVNNAPILVNGVRRRVTLNDIELNSDDFPRLGADFAADTGLEKSGPAGAGVARLMPQRALVDYAVRWMERNRQ
ncbi:MAG: AAC(3) family N-acetyltransferase [Anaerolineae bacterium]